MLWVATWFVLAEMINLKIVRDVTDEKGVSDAVGEP